MTPLERPRVRGRRLAIFAGVVFVAGLALGRFLGSLRPQNPPTGPGPHEAVSMTMSSNDVPGCFTAGQWFEVTIHTGWRDKQSQNTLLFRWSPAPGDSSRIVVEVGGQKLKATVMPGQVLPDVSVTMPIEPAPLTLPLDTLVLERLDGAGHACFGFVHPPDTPRQIFPVTPSET
jgi:hypothetical protein